MRGIVYPMLVHGLSLDGVENMDESISIISQLIFFGTGEGDRIPVEMWRLYTNLLVAMGGTEADPTELGIGYEFFDAG